GPGAAHARRRAAEHRVEDVLEIAAGKPALRAAARIAVLEAAARRGARSPAAGKAAEAALRPAARKALEAGLALGVDLAGVKLLALVGVAENLVGGVDLGKARRRLGIVLVGVGVVLLGELAKRAL